MLPRYLDRDLPQLHNWTWLLVRTVIEEVKVVRRERAEMPVRCRDLG